MGVAVEKDARRTPSSTRAPSGTVTGPAFSVVGVRSARSTTLLRVSSRASAEMGSAVGSSGMASGDKV